MKITDTLPGRIYNFKNIRMVHFHIVINVPLLYPEQLALTKRLDFRRKNPV